MSSLIIPKLAGSVISVNGFAGIVSLSTNNIPENGSLYFTNVRAASAISVTNTSGKGTSYNSSTGVLTISADYLAATPFTFVVRDINGSIIANTGNFTELNVQDQLICQNSITVPVLNVTQQINAPINTTINPISSISFVIDMPYINGPTVTFISVVFSLSSQNGYLPVAGIKIDPAGGTNYTTVIPVIAVGGVYTDVDGTVLSGAQVQATAWVSPSASYIFTTILGVSGQTLVSIVSGSSQQVLFN